MKQALAAGLDRLGIELNEETRDRLTECGTAVLEKNKVMNLTAITDPAQAAELHLLDSLTLLKVLPLAGKSLLDVGTGAGFPGVPMAIAFPEKEFVLLDSLAKRMDAVADICKEAGIDNVTCVHGRAEDAAREAEMREAFDLCAAEV